MCVCVCFLFHCVCCDAPMLLLVTDGNMKMFWWLTNVLGESATSARLVWERLHKVLGYAAVLIAAITIFSGLNALKVNQKLTSSAE